MNILVILSSTLDLNSSIVVGKTPRDGFVRMGQLLIPLNSEHELQSVTIWLRRWCSCLSGITICFFSLGVVVAFPPFIASDNVIQKALSFLPSKQLFTCLSGPVRMVPNVLPSGSFSILVASDSTSSFWVWHESSSNSPHFRMSRTFLVYQACYNGAYSLAASDCKIIIKFYWFQLGYIKLNYQSFHPFLLNFHPRVS